MDIFQSRCQNVVNFLDDMEVCVVLLNHEREGILLLNIISASFLYQKDIKML